MDSINIKCNAKINLSLDVIGKRDDGYHNVELIFDEIDLADEIILKEKKDKKITLSCTDKTLPTDEKNIAYRAAAAFFDTLGEKRGMDITLFKKIPHGAGLAGGSADAAGVLKGLNKMYSNPFSTEQLLKIGVTLGADVPFCIMGGTAFAEGIGEILTPLPKVHNLSYVLVKPEKSISTAFVYNNLDLSKRPKNLNVKKVADAIKLNDRENFYKYSGNIMESVTAKEVPEIIVIKNELINLGAKIALMSGSGTCVFGIFEDKTLASFASGCLQTKYNNVYIVNC